MSGTRMLGNDVFDLKKNTANCKDVNDRMRRRVKRNEKEELKRRLEAGEFFNAFGMFL